MKKRFEIFPSDTVLEKFTKMMQASGVPTKVAFFEQLIDGLYPSWFPDTVSPKTDTVSPNTVLPASDTVSPVTPDTVSQQLEANTKESDTVSPNTVSFKYVQTIRNTVDMPPPKVCPKCKGKIDYDADGAGYHKCNLPLSG